MVKNGHVPHGSFEVELSPMPGEKDDDTMSDRGAGGKRISCVWMVRLDVEVVGLPRFTDSNAVTTEKNGASMVSGRSLFEPSEFEDLPNSRDRDAQECNICISFIW